MKCPNCNVGILDDSNFCTSCGINIIQYGLSVDTVICYSCNQPNKKDANFCTNCRAPLTEQAKTSAQLTLQQAQVKLQMESLRMQNEQLQVQNEQLNMQHMQYDSMVKCPRCGSSSITGNKKGYGVVKGGLGALALGVMTGGVGAVVGLGVGNIGRKKVQCTCMKCGRKFKAGRGK